MVTGASGQIGSELTPLLRERYGKDKVVASDIRDPAPSLGDEGPFVKLDVTNREEIKEIIGEFDVTAIFHLAAILSASGERNPQIAWRVNMTGLYNILEVTRETGVSRIFHPSSIAVFGPETPRDMTPQETILQPKTIYGVTKVMGELLGDYYFNKYGVDVRGVRYPGVISNVGVPGGGTTDYANEMFYGALKSKRYICFVRETTVLPMIYMPDCLKAAVDLMEADLSTLSHHSNFNIAGMSFSAQELTVEIQKHISDFKVEYKPDFRQEIADTWPRSLDDSAAQKEWGWSPNYDLPAMTFDMLEKLEKRLART